MAEINVMSVFDGISCGQLALERAGIKVDNYYASEIDKYAIQVTMKNFPDTIQLGDVTKVAGKGRGINLLIGGSPCQGFSFAGKQLNFDDPRSKLFFEYVRILNEIREENPNALFLLENVKMKKEFQDVISKELGVEPIEINSALVSAQNRKRLYWTNIKGVTQPEDKNILLKDIIINNDTPTAVCHPRRYKEPNRIYTEKSHTLRTPSGGGTNNNYVFQFPHGCSKGGVRDLSKISTVSAQFHNNFFKLVHSQKALDYMNRKVTGGRNHYDFAHHSDIKNNKSSAVVANFFKGVPYNVLIDLGCIRKFHPIECERLQTIPDNYTEGISDTQRYKAIGNGWTVDVVSHIFSFIQKK